MILFCQQWYHCKCNISAYCQLLKLWFRQRSVTTWLHRGPYDTLSRATKWHIQPISEAGKSYSTINIDQDVGDPEYSSQNLPLSELKEPTNIELSFRTEETDVVSLKMCHVG